VALIRNGSHQLSGLSRHYSALGAYGLRSALDSSGKRNNFDSGEHAIAGVTNRAALPEGFRHPMSWKMGTKAGSLSSHIEARITLTPSGYGWMGLPGTATASFAITTNVPDGQLISSGTGTGTLTISTNNPLLTASIGGTGTASWAITTNNALLGAKADGTGAASLTITGNTATIYPLNDASPLRDAFATMTFGGSLTPYATGSMIGSTEDQGLTVAGITNSVWNALLSNYGTSGSAGNTLSLAGSGGVDYDTLAAAILAAAAVTPIHADMKKTNGQTLVGNGTEGDKFRSSLV
jgi:hypothetical protein